jgi:molybdate transport system regulatory protein
MEERLGVRLIVTQSGGVGGGGTELTPQAKEYIRKYRKFSSGLKRMVNRRFREAFEE